MSELTKFMRVFSKAYFNDGVAFLEAGAANGHDTEYFCSAFPDSKIYAFEPDPRFHGNILNLAARYSNLVFDTSALSSYDGITDFYISTRYDENNIPEVWGSSSVLKPKDHIDIHPQIKFDDKPIQVQCVNLDRWMKDNGVTHFDLMWLDMQGNEYEVLKASPNSTEGCSFIFSEVHLVENYEGNKLYNELKNLLESRGFVPFIEELAWADGGNVLFAKKECVELASTIVKKLTGG